jgi:hypothetical protein
VQAAEIGDLLEGKRGVLDQPDGSGLGHQGLGHNDSWNFEGDAKLVAPPSATGRQT